MFKDMTNRAEYRIAEKMKINKTASNNDFLTEEQLNIYQTTYRSITIGANLKKIGLFSWNKWNTTC